MLLEEGGSASSQATLARGRARPEGWAARLRLIPAGLAAPHPVFWAVTVGLVGLDAAWLAASGIRLAPRGFLIVLACVAALLLAAALLGPIKSEPKLRAMALSAASLVAFTVPVAVLQYLTATLALPLADDRLAALEGRLGFDWPGYIGVLAAHPALSWWLSLAYHSSGPQIALVVIALSATARLGRLWAFVRLYAALLLCAVVISAFAPAIGPYAHYQPRLVPAEHLDTVGALWHLEPMARLRAGTLDVIALEDIRGVVTFPSFHVCLAAVTAWALAPVPVIGPLALLLNLVVAVSAVGSGGHYLPDILAGGLLSALLLGGHVLARRGRPLRRGVGRSGAVGASVRSPA